MKLIAHRGASLEKQENTLESLLLGADLGADAVECDPRMTKDGRIVLFHDGDLLRLAGDPRRVNAVTCPEMEEILARRGRTVTTLEELFAKYDGKAPVLLDLATDDDGTGAPRLVCDDAFFAALSGAPIPLICGIHAVEEAASAAKFFPPEQILAFMPEKDTGEAFYKAGAGILRLWEPWLGEIRPADVKRKCPGAQVFVMASRPETGSDGTPESLRYCEALGADGVLLNDIRMALSVMKEGKAALRL